MSFKDFDPKPVFRSFRRLVGEGEVGGKARGLAFAYSVITGSAMEPSVVLPDINYVITTEVFSEFVKDNAVHELLERRAPAGRQLALQPSLEFGRQLRIRPAGREDEVLLGLPLDPGHCSVAPSLSIASRAACHVAVSLPPPPVLL